MGLFRIAALYRRESSLLLIIIDEDSLLIWWIHPLPLGKIRIIYTSNVPIFLLIAVAG